MIAETISLGILSLPSVLARIGLVPGLILIVGLGIIATYTGWVCLSSRSNSKVHYADMRFTRLLANSG
jgi:amino acid permease